MRHRVLVSGILVGLVGLVLIGAFWVHFRATRGTWAWWRPPAVLSVYHRDYLHSRGPLESAAQAQSGGEGKLHQVAREWPMGWSIWSKPPALPGAVPTIVYLRTGQDTYVPYALSGGP